MKDKIIIFTDSQDSLYAYFEKKHWWSKWKLYAMGFNKYNVMSKYDKDIKIIEKNIWL